MAKQDDYVRYTIRVPSDLYERLKNEAGEKSVNAEIVERLDKSFGVWALEYELAELRRLTMDNEGHVQLSVSPYLQSLVKKAAKKFELNSTEMLSSIETLIETLPYEVDRLEKAMERQKTEVDRTRNERFGGRAVTAQVDLLKQELMAAQERVIELERNLAVAEHDRPISDEKVLYVLLDVAGHVTSWPEIYAHLEAIKAAGDFDPDAIHAAIVDARVESSSKREEQWFSLVQHYRRMRGLPGFQDEDE
jgi:hypothetical protein